jgi:sugar lactone lactonase YvrE
LIERRDFLKLAALAYAPVRAVSAGSFPTQIATRVERAFRTPGATPNGLQATTEGLWILDQGTNRVALVRYEDGRVIRQFDTETDRGSGFTFDGSALWIASTYNRLLVRVDAQTGRTLKKLPSPGSGLVKWGPRSGHPEPTGAHGLEWRSGELWVAVPPAVRIFVVNPEDGAVRRSLPAPGIRPHGIGWDPDGSLWCAESIYRSFFKMDPATGRILSQVTLPAEEPQVDGVVQVPHGMTVWNREFWFSVAETGEVYRVPLPA